MRFDICLWLNHVFKANLFNFTDTNLFFPVFVQSFSSKLHLALPFNMTPNQNASEELSEQVGAKRPKPYHKDDP